MLSKSVQDFNDRVAASLELQTKLRAITSPMDFLSLAKAEGLDLNGQDFQSMVQQAYQQWCETLNPKMSDFFRRVHNDKELDVDTPRRERARILLSTSQLTQAGLRQPKQRSILQKRYLHQVQRFPYALRCLIVLHFLRSVSGT
jgi:Nif11 domain